MAEDKRFYWVKLDYRRFETGGDLDFLMGQKGGAEYVVLYMMLCLNTRNTQGEFVSRLGEVVIPYDVDKIVRDCKYFSRDTVMVALELYRQLGLVYVTDGGTMRIANFDEVVGSESQSARWMRDKRSRDRQAKLTSDATERAQCEHNVTDNVLTKCSQSEAHCESDVMQEKRDKREENRELIEGSTLVDDSSLRSSSTGAPAREETCDGDPPTSPSSDIPAVITILTDTGGKYPVTQEYVDTMQELYPAVDVQAQLRAMKAWAISNPNRRKTAKGMPRFINRWLAEEQRRATEHARDRPDAGRGHMAKDNDDQYADDRRDETWEQV